MKIHGIDWLCWLLHEQTCICIWVRFWEILHEGVQETIEDNSVGDGGRWEQHELPTEEKITLFLSAGMILRLWKHILRKQREHPALVSGLFVGEIWTLSNELSLITKKETRYHACILCVLFFTRLCKHKKCESSFFCWPILLTCKSVRSQWRNCWA